MESVYNLPREISKTLSQTYALLTTSLIFTTLVTLFCASTGLMVTNGWVMLALVVASFVTLFLSFSSNVYIALGALLSFAGIWGVLLTNAVVKVDISTILLTLITTMFIFVGLSAYVITTGRDFAGLGNYLLGALLIVLVMSVVNIFLQVDMLKMVLSYVSVLVFSGFILYDTSEITNGRLTNPVVGAISLYLNVLNLFMDLLTIFED